MKGEITNVGNDTIQFVWVTVHFYDSSGGLIGDSSCCYTTPDSIEPHHTVTFDSFANKDEITAIQAATGYHLIGNETNRRRGCIKEFSPNSRSRIEFLATRIITFKIIAAPNIKKFNNSKSA
ncbi:MAG: FxLYD domain-containing protein [Candidatus Nitrosopolaris sp.]